MGPNCSDSKTRRDETRRDKLGRDEKKPTNEEFVYYVRCDLENITVYVPWRSLLPT